MRFFVKISKFEKNFNMPGKIHFLIIRHVLFVVDLFWSRKWKKNLKLNFLKIFGPNILKMPYKPLFLLKIEKNIKMIVNRDYIFSSYKDITISYIFPQIRTF